MSGSDHAAASEANRELASGDRASRLARPAMFGWALAAIVLVFGAVRLACVFNNLWLDEIWSLRLVEGLRSPMQILTDLRHDNNHPLNSFFLYLVKPGKADWVYRLLSWVTGTAAVGVAGLCGRRQFRLVQGDARAAANVAGLIAAALFGGCFLLVHYSSEARGYAPAVLGALVALYALTHADEARSSGWMTVYALACILGLLSHAVMFQCLVGGLAWTIVRVWQDRRKGCGTMLRLAAWQGVPWLFFFAYYFGFLRHVEIGGGPDHRLLPILGELAAYTLGLPASAGTCLALPLFAVAMAFAWWTMARRHAAFAALYVVMIVVAPAIALAASGFTLLFPRYFILSAAGMLLLVSYGLADAARRRGASQALAALLMAGFLAGNAIHVARLVRLGRGQYVAALRYIAEHTPTASIGVCSDYDDRNYLVMAYYAGAVGAGRSIDYYPNNDLPAGGPEWLFQHRLDEDPVPPEVFYLGPVGYRLERVFPHAALSGWDWYVYRNSKYAMAAGAR